MIEMRWKNVGFEFGKNSLCVEADNDEEICVVLQYRTVLEFDTETGPAIGKGEWLDVEIQDD